MSVNGITLLRTEYREARKDRMKESSQEVPGIIQTRQNGGLGQGGNNGYALKAKSRRFSDGLENMSPFFLFIDNN